MVLRWFQRVIRDKKNFEFPGKLDQLMSKDMYQLEPGKLFKTNPGKII